MMTDEPRRLIPRCTVPVSPHWALTLVADVLLVTPQQLVGRERYAELVDGRAAIAIGLRARGATLRSIGALLGNRDHSTIINLLRANNDRMARIVPLIAQIAQHPEAAA